MSEKKLLIVGASSDIGIEFIKGLEPDFKVAAHYNSSANRFEEINATERNLSLFQADLLSERGTEEFLDRIESEFGIPNMLLFLAAPKFQYKRFKELSWEEFQNEIDVSVRATYQIAKRFLPKISKDKFGKVVVMLSSITLCVPPKALAHYVTSKYALMGLVKALASEYADKNIQFNSISPSMIETGFLSEINEKFIEINAHNHPLKRNGKPGDVVSLIKFLLSSGSDYISGVNIPVSGGSIF